MIETRYLDLDFRSEYSAYYSRQFADIPDSTHRLHFFFENLSAGSLWQDAAQAGYLGYVVVRPASTGLVSRALLPPPPDLAEAVRTCVTEKVSFFGQQLTITGVPFAQQDAQLGACAQAAAWMCHYSAHVRGDTARRTKADFSLMADASLQPNRGLPSGGLTVVQLSDLFRRFELPAMFYSVGDLPSPHLPWQPDDPIPPTLDGPSASPPGSWDHRIIPVACRHLNSGNPVLVGTHDHAFVLCGYRRTDAPQRGWIEFIRHDDQAGPYLLVTNVLNDIDPRSGKVYGAWRTMHVPVPEKLWLAPEAAERKGGLYLVKASRQIAAVAPSLPFEPIDDLIAAGRLSLRTYAIRSNDFKRNLAGRGLHASIVQEYALARLPRYIWVVEAIDRDLREAGRPAVVGEAVLDATSSDHAPEEIALHVHGVMWLQQTSRRIRFPILGDPRAYESGGVGVA
ncbi:hypothetical protein [Nocardioides sp. YR527]|uniref:hypothetical protein n=1 Tax=Nocardioides sp. YR527 TaxID=1881028 RepID=UPI000A49341C|nr:hypothetical protein [Nocardioides sp. YR527]